MSRHQSFRDYLVQLQNQLSTTYLLAVWEVPELKSAIFVTEGSRRDARLGMLIINSSLGCGLSRLALSLANGFVCLPVGALVLGGAVRDRLAGTTILETILLAANLATMRALL
jgi:riboflavin transporter FmnP